MNNQSMALATQQPQQLTLSDKVEMCKLLCDAPDMLPKHYLGKPGNVLVALELGRCLGIEPVVAMMEIYMVNNRPSMSARMMNALVRKAGHSITITSTSDSATCSITRRDSPTNATVVTFTKEDAQKAGLLTKDGPWKLYPQRMLESRAVAACVRLAAPDIILGMAYTPEELGDDRAEFVDVLPAQVVERPAEEPGTSKSYSRIRVVDAQPVTETEPAPKRTRKKDAAPEPEQAPQVDASPANDWDDNLPSKDNSPASEAAISDAWEAWKSYYAFDRQTGEKKAGLAKEMLEKIFPGLSMRNATVAQIDAVQGHLAEQAASF